MAAEVAKMELEVESVDLDEAPRQVLAKYRPDMKYTETNGTDSGVTVMTEIDNHEFHGVGPDFVTAAERAALEVLTYLYSTEEICFGVEKFNKLMTWKNNPSNGTPTQQATTASLPTKLSPLMVFNQIYMKGNPEWNVVQTSSMPSRYHATLKINEQTFEADEASKKQAKQKAAEAALIALRGGSLETLLTPSPSRKRRNEDGRPVSQNAATPPKRKRRQEPREGPFVFVDTKHPLQILNEFKRGVVFETVTQDGPSHSPRIVMKCVVDEKSFEAEGTSKQKAKHQLAIDIITHFQELGQIQVVPATEGSQPKPAASPAVPEKPSPQVVGSGAGGKTPLMMLYELTKCQLPCVVSEHEENKMKRFVAKYTYKDKTFEAEGLSKQRAKHKAAEIILRDVFGLQMGGAGTNGEGSFGELSGDSDVRMLQFVDRVRKAVLEKWRSLCANLSEENAKRKVIAGIVMTMDVKQEPVDMDDETRDEQPDLFSTEDLLCVTTGTKCLNGEFLSQSGIVINDCHAEVLSSRCLRLLLFRHVEKLAKGESSILLERRNDGGIGLRSGIKFHLYISTAPCGDARIFCPHDIGSEMGDTHPGRKSRGLLRTKIESGEGTIPVPIHGLGIQTFDGVLQGERLLTMSCSDKLLQWNVLGMQGALLSRILNEPIYYSTIIIGSVFVESHLDRALYQRVADILDIPQPFQIHRPACMVTTERDERMPRKSPNISVVWMDGDDGGAGDVEVIIAARGKQDDDKPSRLCKQAMYKTFKAIERQYPSVIHQKSKTTEREAYAEAKASAAEYMESKRLLQLHLKNSGSGAWIRRPMEQDLFELVE